MATQIFEIHGMSPNDELTDRGRMVTGSAGYIPYTGLTKGEMSLALLLEQANIYAAAYPENKEYRQAAAMLKDALYAGVSNGVKFVGALYNPLLQQVAKEVAKASRQTAPASKGGILGRTSIAQGIKGIGEPIVFAFDHDCVQYATKEANRKYRVQLGGDKSWQWWEYNVNDSAHRRYYREQKAWCKTRIEIEKIVNDRITDASHHVLYYGLDDAYPAIKGSDVSTKRILHVGGIGGLANATDTDASLMSRWSETSILRRNTQVSVGPIGSIISSLNLSKEADAYLKSYEIWQKDRIYQHEKAAKMRAGAAKIGEPITIAAVTALVTAIGAAVAKAAEFQRQLNQKKSNAMAGAQNYGTLALEAKPSDWPNTPPAESSSNGLLLFGAAAAGIYFLTQD